MYILNRYTVCKNRSCGFGRTTYLDIYIGHPSGKLITTRSGKGIGGYSLIGITSNAADRCHRAATTRTGIKRNSQCRSGICSPRTGVCITATTAYRELVIRCRHGLVSRLVPLIVPGFQGFVRRIFTYKNQGVISITRNRCFIHSRVGAVFCQTHFHPIIFAVICTIIVIDSEPSIGISPTGTHLQINHFLPLSIKGDIVGDAVYRCSGCISRSRAILIRVPAGKRPTRTRKPIRPQGLRTVTGNSRVACRTTTCITVTLEGNGISWSRISATREGSFSVAPTSTCEFIVGTNSNIFRLIPEITSTPYQSCRTLTLTGKDHTCISTWDVCIVNICLTGR